MVVPISTAAPSPPHSGTATQGCRETGREAPSQTTQACPERVQGHGTIAGQPGTAGQTALAAGREQRALLRIGRRHRAGDGGQTLPAGPVAAAGGLRFPQAGPLKGAEQRFAGPAFDRMSPVRPMYGNNRHESPPETVK